MTEQACRECRRIVEGQVCPICNSASLSKDWSGYVVIIDPKESIIAERLEIKLPRQVRFEGAIDCVHSFCRKIFGYCSRVHWAGCTRATASDCVEAMRDELAGARKVIAIGDMTAFYLLKSSIMPDLAVVDNKTKRAQLPDHILQSLEHDSYKRIEVKNPPATLTEELIDQIKDSLAARSG